MKYTKEDILKDFDSNGGEKNPYKFFLTLEDPYISISSNKIHLYADKERWAVIFESNGYDTHGYCIRKAHNYYGNCLSNLDNAGLNGMYILNTKYFILCSEENIMKISNDLGIVSDSAKTITIRNIEIPIEHNSDNISWEKNNITKSSIDLSTMTRMLNFQYPEIFNSSEDELRTCIPKDLHKLMTIDEWHHVDCYRVRDFEDNIPFPSSIEIFKQIAEVLETKDVKKYKPTLKPNSHWSNWESGFL